MPTDISQTGTTLLRTVVLKFGGSVLTSESDLPRLVHECYRWLRRGHRVVAVVSAIGDTTDRLVAKANGYGHAPDDRAFAALIATGELTSAAHAWLACDRAGLDAVALDPRAIGFRVSGPATDAAPSSLDADGLRRALARHDIVIVPGFVGVGDEGHLALLGRGGSDLTAILLGHALGARCRLVKDVPGLFERDPARPGPFARRYASVTFEDAARLDGTILQRKALSYASTHRYAFEVGSVGAAEATLVGAATTTFAPERQPPASPGIALLGFGVVGRGVWQHLRTDATNVRLIGVAVRTPKRHADVIAPRLLVADALALAEDSRAEVVIEAIGGVDLARRAVETALRRGATVITANKSLIALAGAELTEIARTSGGDLRYAAAVGGAAPCVELVERLAPRGIASLEGVLNGTTNYLLARRATGVPFAAALAEAQALGFTESDPSADVDGIDAAEKIGILARLAFGAHPTRARVEGIRHLRDIAPTTKLVARASLQGDAIAIRVAPEVRDEGDSLALTRGEWNRLRVTCSDGSTVEVSGKGAGRWPTAEAIYADLLDACATRSSAQASRDAQEALHA